MLYKKENLQQLQWQEDKEQDLDIVDQKEPMI